LKTPDLMELTQDKGYKFLYRLVSFLRILFVSIMVLYLISCLFSLGEKLLVILRSSKFLISFPVMKEFLTDSLFVLIILDFISAMFYSKRIHYVLALLEIGFIVITRKLILLDPKPENASLIFVLSLAVSVFFYLIFHFYRVTGRLRKGAVDR